MKNQPNFLLTTLQKKYQKLYSRLQKAINSGRLSRFSVSKKQQLLSCLSRYEKQLKHWGISLAASAALLLPATMLSQPTAAGSEFRVNTFTLSGQSHPSVAMDDNGNFVAVWHSNGQDGSSDGVYAQLYNQAGIAQGSEFMVNTYTTDRQFLPSVAMDSDGDFVVSWNSYEQDGNHYGIYAQRYDSDGIPQGSEFQVNTYTTGSQFDHSVAMDVNGNFIIAWQSAGQDGSGYGVYAQRYSDLGVPQGTEFQVNTYTTSTQGRPEAAFDTNGNFVIAWHSNNRTVPPADYGIYAQRYNNAGSPLGSEFQVNTYTTYSQIDPDVAMDDDGDFIVTWMSYNQDGDYYGVYAQRYNANGATLGIEFQVNTFTTHKQAQPSVAMDSDGDFLISWHSGDPNGPVVQDGSSRGVYAQAYNNNGTIVGSEFRVNTYTTADQSFPSVASDTDGDLVIAWRSDGQDGSSASVYAQRYTVLCTPQNWYTDADGDLYGAGTPISACIQPPNTVANNTDCDDSPTGGNVNPGATEICNGLDDDCDLLVDAADPNLVDNIPPTVQCPPNQTVSLDGNCDPVYPDPLSYGDNCTALQDIAISATTIVFYIPVYKIIVTLQAIDGNNNYSIPCTYTIFPEDQTPPQITCPNNQTVFPNANCANVVGAWNPDSFSDNCMSQGNFSITQSPAPSTVLSGNNDSETVTLTADDGNGNTNSCSFTVTLIANAPEICDGLDNNCDGITETYSPDLAALIDFYNSTGGPNWTNNSGWIDGAAGIDCDPCDWYGVTCNSSGRVIGINLNNNNLNGPLPNTIDGLTYLQSLLLYNNNLTGIIPIEVGYLPNLTLIRLEFNALTGSIPSSIGGLANLQYLYMSNNLLSGPIPSSLGSLSNLLVLILSNNQLNGSIPGSFIGLINCYNLAIADNQLSGTIPGQLSAMTNLGTLSLGNNLLASPIPDLSGLANLTSLQLSQNLFNGPIPTWLGNMTWLNYLFLDRNQFSGSIPGELGNLTNLSALYLFQNQLSGCYPPNLNNLCPMSVNDLLLSGNPGLPGGGSATVWTDFCTNGTGGDADLDGFCKGNGAGYDCNDTNSNIFPGATELCDGLDNDCDGNTDEGLGILYVNVNALGANNGTSWANAFTNLQNALSGVCPGITTQIWVAQGTYKPTIGTDPTISFVMKNNLAIYGGFIGTETLLSQRDWVNNVTVLSGDIGVVGLNSDNSNSVIKNIGLNNTAVIDGITIRDGFSSSGNGGGMNNYSSFPKVNNCIFKENYAQYFGGGMFNLYQSPSICNCIFSGNTASVHGGGIFNWASSPSVNNCTFSGNKAVNEGSGMNNYSSSSPVLINCTFSGNKSVNNGGVLTSDQNSNLTLKNCIIWGNSSGVFNTNNSTPVYTNTMVQGLYLNPGVFSGITDPLFINQPDFNNAPTTVGDLHLQICSPAIDVGTNSGAPLLDLDGSPRPHDGDGNGNARTDLGAYEFQGTWQTWYKDLDGDGYSDGVTQVACTMPVGYKLLANLIAPPTGGNVDCNDNDPIQFPGQIWYKDKDNDGYSDGSLKVQCSKPTFYQASANLLATTGDCNDNDPLQFPGQVWFKDKDNDGYSDGMIKVQCLKPTNYQTSVSLIATSGDCNDNDATQFPGQTWYKDLDNDGYSNGTILVQCAKPTGYKLTSNLIATSGDCQDGAGSVAGTPNATMASIHPNAVEACNGIDDNCNVTEDEGLSGLNYTGNVVFNSQTKVNDWPSCYTKITGNLTINSSSVINLQQLINLTEVTGNITIQTTGLPNLNGLDNLHIVGGSLIVKQNNNGVKLTSLSGLQGVLSVGANLQVTQNNILVDCCPIELLLINGGVLGTININNPMTPCNTASQILLACPNFTGGNSNNLVVVPPCDDCPIAWQEVPGMEVRLFPNPTTGELTLQFNSSVPVNGSVEIVDLYGRLLHTEILPTNGGECRLSIATLPAGVYFVRFLEEGVPVWVQRLVKH